MKSEIDLLTHANICLEYFHENKADNADPIAYIGARYLFKFKNNLVLSYLSSDEVYLYCSDNSLDLDLPKKDWIYRSEAGAWKSKEHIKPDFLLELVEQFSTRYGRATFALPWIDWLERYGPMGSDWEDMEMAFEMNGEIDELQNFRASREQSRLSLEFIEEQMQSSPQNLAFNLEKDFEVGDFLLPPSSQFSRLKLFWQELESRGWIIINYMTDHGFAFDRLQEERDELGKKSIAPGLVSPLEHVWNCYQPSGILDEWIGIIDPGNGNMDDLNCAKDFGLRVEIRHDDQLTILAD